MKPEIINLTIVECKFISSARHYLILILIINLTIVECKFEDTPDVFGEEIIINLTIVECKSKTIYRTYINKRNNKSNHSGM